MAKCQNRSDKGMQKSQTGSKVVESGLISQKKAREERSESYNGVRSQGEGKKQKELGGREREREGAKGKRELCLSPAHSV